MDESEGTTLDRITRSLLPVSKMSCTGVFELPRSSSMIYCLISYIKALQLHAYVKSIVIAQCSPRWSRVWRW